MSHLSADFISEMKQKLEEEKLKLEGQLESFAKKDKHEESDYDTSFPEYGSTEEDNAAEVASYDSSLSVEHNLESHLADVNGALKRIEDDTYGICLKTGKPISENRLRALPSAKFALEK
ncbi:MAG: TraR/DksA C4-type zinc finger protein [bacterium]